MAFHATIKLFSLTQKDVKRMPLIENNTLHQWLFAEESLSPLDALRLDDVLKTRPPFYFVGIGGAGMSALALALHAKGFDVSGSDVTTSSTTRRLQETGVTVFQGHQAGQVPKQAVVVLSTAIDEKNPEVQQALARQQPLWHRSQVLQGLMHSPCLGSSTTIGLTGTHGKTTLTGLMDSVLLQAKFPALTLAGGKLPQLGQNLRLTEGATTCVAELDESDGTILRYAPTFTILANLELDHADHYTDGLTHLLNTFERFFSQLTRFSERHMAPTPSIILNGQCENTLKIIHALPEDVRRFWIFDDKNRADDFKEIGTRYLIQTQAEGFSLSVKTAETWEPIESPTNEPLRLSIPGHHNVWNASMVAVVALQLGIAMGDVAKGLEAFTGMGRRFEIVGHYKNALWIDDYAHHPTEVNVTLQASRQYMQRLGLTGKLIACFQPHRYTRLQALWDGFLDAFKEADVVYILDTFHAFEAPITGIDSPHFVDALKAKFPQQTIAYAPDVATLQATLAETVHAQDVVLSMGAGTITHLFRTTPFHDVRGTNGC